MFENNSRNCRCTHTPKILNWKGLSEITRGRNKKIKIEVCSVSKDVVGIESVYFLFIHLNIFKNLNDAHTYKKGNIADGLVT